VAGSYTGPSEVRFWPLATTLGTDSDLTVIIALAGSSGSCDSSARPRCCSAWTGILLCRQFTINGRIMLGTYMTLAKTSSISHAFTQSTVQRVLSSSSSDGSGGSSAA
jgi:hypothetical protein